MSQKTNAKMSRARKLGESVQNSAKTLPHPKKESRANGEELLVVWGAGQEVCGGVM
jgi:hypothetical protein